MACPECQNINNDCNCQEEYCYCEHKLSAVCILYEGVKLTLLDTYEGQNLENILKEVEALFSDIYNKLQGSLNKNVGTGAGVFKQLNHLSQAEFRSLLSSSSINVIENLNDIGISINEAWLTSWVSSNTTDVVTNITNTIVSGKRIATYTNESSIATDIRETVTTLVDNGNGTFTYTNENGTPVTFDASSTEALTTIINTKAGSRIATYTNELGTPVDINETITQLVNNGDNTLNYTNESGAINTYSPLNASDANKGVVELATNTETQTGADTTRAITPAGLSSRTATETRTGILEVATASEANALIADDKIITPAKIPVASATQRGIVELATQAEVDTGTDTTRAVTPATLQSKITGLGLFTKQYEQTITSWGNGDAKVYSHGLGTIPKIVTITLVAKTSYNDYNAGDELVIANTYSVRPDTPQFSGVATTLTSTQVFLKIGLNITVPQQAKTTATNSDRTLITDSTYFSIRVRLYA